MRHQVTLGDGPVRLDPLLPEHATDAYVAWLNDPAVTGKTEQRYQQHTVNSVRAYIESTLDAADALIWRITLDGRHVGNIRLSQVNRHHARAMIALIIGESACRGRGVGSAAIDLLARHALSALGLHKVTAGIYSTNMASRRAFEKAGFHLEATFREHAREDGRFIDVWEMARFAG